MLVLLWEGRRKFGGARWLRQKLVPHLQAQVPHPLRDHLPAFLPPGAVAAPAVRFLLDVFVGEGGFKGAAMQVKRHPIGGGEGVLGQIGQEEFLHHAVADESDLALLLLLSRGRVGRHNDAHERSVLREALVWTVVERAADPTFRALEVLISRQVQASLDVDVIEEVVVFAAGHVGKIAQIGDDCSGPILTIKAYQRAFSGKAVGPDVLLDGSFRPAQFLTILSVARIGKAGDPLMGMHLQDRRARPHNFSPFASGVAGGTEGTPASVGSRPIWDLG